MKNLILMSLLFGSTSLFATCLPKKEGKKETVQSVEELLLFSSISGTESIEIDYRTCSNEELTVLRKELYLVINKAAKSYNKITAKDNAALAYNYNQAAFLFSSISAARSAIMHIDQEEKMRTLDEKLSKILEYQKYNSDQELDSRP